MNWWEVVILLFVIGLLPWRVLHYIRRANDNQIPKDAKPAKTNDRDETDGFW